MISIKEIERINGVTNIMLAALNDWPHNVGSLNEFEKQVSDFIKCETSITNLRKALSQIDFSKNAWEAESLTQMLELFDYFPECDNLRCVFEILLKRN